MPESLWVNETFENASEGYRFGESGVYDTGEDSLGELYRTLRSEYGRCEGKVYVDTTEGPPKAIGWVFIKRLPYEDSPDTYLRRVWVTVHDAPDTVTRTHHYHEVTS